MAPWEKYQKQAGPWAKYQPAAAEPATNEPSTAYDMLRGLGTGIRQGFEGVASMFGDVNALQGNIAGWAAEKLGASPETAEAVSGVARRFSPMPFAPTSAEVQTISDAAMGERYEPQTTAGEYSRTVGQFAPGALVGPGSLPTRLLTQAVLPGIGSEAAGQITEGTAAEPYARIAGALAGSLAPAAASKLISPMRVDPARQQAAAVLRREGVNPTAGQLSGSRSLRAMESELGGGKVAQMMDDQAEAFTSAALKRAGGSGRATSDNMAAISDRLSQGFKAISARNTVRADPQLVDDMNRTMREYGRVLKSEQREIVSNLGQDLVDEFRKGGGVISGKDYQTWRSRFSKRAQNARGADNDLADAWRGLRNALDDAMARSVRPEDAAEWAELRRQWGNLKVLENAAVGGGEDAAMGLISPAKLRQAAGSGKSRGAYARGEGDFAELAKAGQALLTPLPNSGTATRLTARNLGTSLTTLIGAGAGASAGAPGAMLGAAIGALAPAAAGRALLSRPVQAYLTNQLATNWAARDPRIAAIAAALLSRPQGSAPAIAP